MAAVASGAMTGRSMANSAPVTSSRVVINRSSKLLNKSSSAIAARSSRGDAVSNSRLPLMPTSILLVSVKSSSGKKMRSRSPICSIPDISVKLLNASPSNWGKVESSGNSSAANSKKSTCNDDCGNVSLLRLHGSGFANEICSGKSLPSCTHTAGGSNRGSRSDAIQLSAATPSRSSAVGAELAD